MNTFAASMVLLGLAVTLVLAGISIFVFRTPMTAADGTQPLTRFFLVALRLSIGWHFFVEGMDKLNSPSWSSEPYLREATGPLAPFYRDLAGDRLIDKLTVAEDGAFPAELDAEWQAYFNAFTNFYELDAQQTQQAKSVLVSTEAKTKTWLQTTPKDVQKVSEYPPPLMVAMTIPKRLKEYEELEAKLRKIEDIDIPQYGADSFAKLKIAKANLSKWRTELKTDLDKQTLDFKQALRDQVLLPIAKQALPAEYQGKVNAKDPVLSLRTIYHQLLLKQGRDDQVKLTPQAAKIFEYAIDNKKGNKNLNEPLPASALPHSGQPIQSWGLLEWSDTLVKWGITLTGAFLLLGLLTRTACVVGAGLLLMFFLAMPPLPGWPESPRAEGHYLFINKNIIEMLALLALATTRSGRWVGIDSLLQLLRPKRWQNAPPSSNLDKGASLGEAPTVAIE